MNKELITRFYEFDVNGEAEESTAILTGRPIVYNSRTDLGYFDEVIDSGALNNTDLTDVRFLVNHDTSKIPLARSLRNNGSSTMQLSVDEGGMAIRAEIDIENNAEARLLRGQLLMRMGDKKGASEDAKWLLEHHPELMSDMNGEFKMGKM
jgi:HK97 family phage prohead protease